jgi:hypothetical protein
MNKDPDFNRDPLSGAPGAHPVGAGAGAAGGAIAGAAAGTIAGPVGAAVGAVIGGLAGGVAGKVMAEAVNPTAEEAFWAENFRNESYYDPAYTYDDYSPAYRHGYGGRGRYQDRTWDEAEKDLESNWDTVKGQSRLGWDKAKHASRAAWVRVEDAIPGDSDRDGH